MYAHLGAIAELVGVGTTTAKTPVASQFTPHVRLIVDHVLHIAHSLSYDMNVVVVNKLEVNCRKYPADVCRSTADTAGIEKYWHHCWRTGISKGTPSVVLRGDGRMLDSQAFDVYACCFREHASQLHRLILAFAADRQWVAKYTYSNTFMALSTEIGELAEHFHWLESTCASSCSSDSSSKTTINDNAVASELADILIYCIHFFRVVGDQL